jgi:thermostable 8-oxoguanine DNA glycosylase
MKSTRNRRGRGSRAPACLTPEDRTRLDSLRATINARLNDFAVVPWTQWGREIAFCLLTPQSSAIHAEACIAVLESGGFFSGSSDP